MKKYLKKLLSTFLALLMVFTSLVFVAPEVVPEAGAAYNMGSAAAPDTYIRMVSPGNTAEWVAMYYPSNIYLDVTETLEGVGYYFNFTEFTYNNTSKGRRTLLFPSLYGGVGEVTKDDTLHTDAFTNYGVSKTTGGNGTVGTSNYNTNDTANTVYMQYVEKKTYTAYKAMQIYVKGSPKADAVGKTLTYSTSTGDSLLWGGQSQGYNSDNNLSGGWSDETDSTFTYSTAHADRIYDINGNSGAKISINVHIYDKSALQAKITEAKNIGSALYTEASYNSLQSAIGIAETKLKTREMKQSDVDTAVENLQKAIDALVFRTYDANFENLFSFADWATNAPDFSGNASIDYHNGKLTLTNTAAVEQTLKSSYRIPVTAGKTYTLEYTRGEALNTDVYVFYNDSTASGLFSDSVNRLSTNEAKTVSKEFTIPSGVTFVTIRFDANYNKDTDNKYTFSNIKFYETSRRENVVISNDRIPVQGQGALGELPTATKTGYTLEGWYTGIDGTGTKISAETILNGSTTYYAKWTPVKNKAEFYTYDGQLHATVTGEYNTKISAAQPAAPASYTNDAGTYVFYRWVNMETGEALGNEVFEGLTEGELVAQYKAEYKRSGDLTTYTATFKNPADSSYNQTVSGKFNTSLSSPATYPTKASEKINGVDAYDYEFIGWSLSEEGDVVIKPGNAFRILENVTYYAQFERKLAQHTIITQFGTNNGGANSGSLDYTAGYGEWVAVPNPSEWRDNTNSYLFSHWVDTKGNTYEPSGKETMIQVLGADTYTAVYDSVPVRYHAYFYNGTEQLVDQELQFGSYVTVPEIEDPTKDRVGNTTYEFDGWYLYDTETEEWGEKLEDNKFRITGEDYTFYAKYNEIKWSSVSFLKDADSDYELIGETKEYKYGETVVVPEGPAKESTAQYDYTFTGWTEYYDGQVGAFYAVGDEITAPARESATLYIATYESTVRKYTVTFYGEDGVTVIGDPQTIEYGSKPVAPADPTKESTERYDYTFDGWYDGSRLYGGTELPEVTGDTTYTAIFTGRDIYYQVHWLTPSAEGIKTYTTVNYTYNRIVSMPATAPEYANDEVQAGKTWGFAGWYLSDANGNLLDAEGNITTDYENEGVAFVKGTHITGTLYYVAVFDFLPNPYKVNVYNEDGSQLLKTYSGTYGTYVDVTNFGKDSTSDDHYILKGFATTAGGEVVYAAATVTEDGVTTLDSTTAILVNGNLDIYVVYEEEAHKWGDWVIDEEPTYAQAGSKHRNCTECDYREDNTTADDVKQLVDTTAPQGQITIGGNSWSNEYVEGADGEPIWNYESTAYVREDAIISVLTTDVGKGIKSIKYTWSDGTTHTYNVEDEFDTEVNYNFLLPEDFAGKYINVVVTDYVGKTYKLQTATLQSDEAAPTIQTHIDCLWFGFMVTDDHEVDGNSIKVTDADGKNVPFQWTQVKDDEGNVTEEGYVVGDMEEKTALKAGTYTITVSDKAGNTSETEVNVVGEHVSSDWIVDTEADCLTAGAKHKECTACAKVLEEEVIAALGHDEENAYWVTDTEPACEVAGEKSLRCARCEEKLMVAPIDALEHDYEAVVTEPTCTDKGYTTYTCVLCDDEYIDDYVNEKGHDMQIVEEVAPTCEEAGYTVYECANGCGETETVPGDPALNHPEAERETIVIESECTGSKITKIVCKLCGEVLEQEGDLDGHTWVEEKVAATCTADAYTVKTCSKCDAEITIVDRLTKLGHAWDADYTTDKAATCTTAGSESIHCSACKETKDAREIPALGHDLVLDEESKKEATCNTDGYEKWECSRCDHEEEKVIKATGEHNFTILDEEASKAATCTEDGVTVYKCGGKDCTAVNKVVIPATGHEKGDKKSETTGDCQTKSTITYACKNCDATITEEGAYGSHTASDVLVKTTKAPTCTATGDGVFKCKDCDATVIVENGIAALGHDYKEVVTDATCVEDGYTIKTCSRCGDIQNVPGEEATGEHTWETEYRIISEATCTVNGSKAIYCSVCDVVKEGSTVIITAPGHVNSDWITDTKATCTEDGSKHIECTVCGTTIKTETIPSLGGHTQGALVKTNTPATCSAVGEGVYKCTTCGETYVDVIPVDVENHSYSEWTTVDATCTEAGYKSKTCTNKDANGKVCGDEIKKVIPATDHDYRFTKEEVIEKGGNFITKTTYTCTRCKGTNVVETTTTAFLVTIVDQFNGKTSSVILKDGAQLRKADLPEIALPDDVAETTYVLKWTDASGNELKFPMDVTSNITIYAKVEAVTKTYTVSFVNNAGKIISAKEYTYGATVDVPEDQVLLNSTFLGWSDGTNTYEAEAIPTVTGDATYYAKFQANAGVKTYYVTFKNETGVKTIFTQTVTEGGNATAPETALTKANNSVYHYVFAGWYTATEGGSAYDFNTAVSANITVYARFTAVKHADNASHKDTVATCSNPASKAYTCNVCGYEWVTYTDPATGHTYKESSRTTTADGKVMVTYVCSVCGDTWTKTVTQGMADSNAITVTVTDTSGNAVEGASVEIYLGELKVTVAVTNAKGKAYFAKDVVADDSYRVNVSKDGYDDLSGTLVVKDGKGTVKLSSFSITECHSVCHADSFFGNIRRWFTDLLRILFKNYTCCDCGNCGHIY